MTLISDLGRRIPEQIRSQAALGPDHWIRGGDDGKLAADTHWHQQNSVTFWPEVPGDLIGKYANDCLESAFKDSGLAYRI